MAGFAAAVDRHHQQAAEPRARRPLSNVTSSRKPLTLGIKPRVIPNASGLLALVMVSHHRILGGTATRSAGPPLDPYVPGKYPGGTCA
jgi:hypothetical protein